ncbi:ribonuclease H protein, partial [Trifolium medium]|nr:ribonuclease H protein [Trifolium medium]
SDYIHNGQWTIPSQLSQQFNTPSYLVHQVTIPTESSQDQLIWKHSDSGDLQLSDAYKFKHQHLQELHWAKVIWSLDIPHSKSLLVWRLMHNKMPTDDNLMIRGFGLGNNSKKSSSNSIRDFIILKHFNVSTHHSTPPLIKEVLWQPPLINWIKCNIDEAAKGSPGIASCGGVFRDHAAALYYCFAEPLGETSSFQAKLCAAMRAIEVAYSMNWNNLWLESDSELVVQAFKNTNFMVAWNLRNRWHNVKFLLSRMNCIVSHIYR